MNETQSKTIRLIDYEKATAHSYIITDLPDSHVASSEGYGDSHKQYTRLDPSATTSHYDLRELKNAEGMTEAMYDFLKETDFEEMEDTREYEVGEDAP